MNKQSFQKLSVLGLVLMGTSAVTAAILPKTSKGSKAFTAGHMYYDSETFNGSEGQLSCHVIGANQTVDCDYTVTDNAVLGSYTTDGNAGTSTDALDTTGASNTGENIIGGLQVSAVPSEILCNSSIKR